MLWLIWSFTAIGIYLTLYIDTDILSFMAEDRSRITWLITALFVIGWATSFVLTMIITTEAVEATNMERIAMEDGLVGIEPKKRKKAVHRFFQALKTVAEANEAPDIAALLNVELSSLNRISRFVEVFGNLLITLGLIGTVMGLTFTLTGLTGSLEALGQDQELLLQGLREAMGGMGTAFYTTLLGSILGGVLLRVYALITETGIESLYDGLMRICLVYCSADFKPTLEKDIRFLNNEIQNLGASVDVLEAAFKNTRAAMQGFREEAEHLNTLSGQAEDEKTQLGKTIRLHKYYRAILRRELDLMNRMNRSWWGRFRRLFRRR